MATRTDPRTAKAHGLLQPGALDRLTIAQIRAEAMTFGWAYLTKLSRSDLLRVFKKDLANLVEKGRAGA